MLLFAARGMHWYDLVLLPLAAAIVFPDHVAAWIGDRMGREATIRHVLLFEAIAIGLLVLAMESLMPIYPRLDWQLPLIFIGICAFLRGAGHFAEMVTG